MEGLMRLLSYSMRGWGRWSESFLFPKGVPDFALIPAMHEVGEPTRTENNEFEEEESGNPSSWSGFLWGVPKKRTTIMKRLRRKFGHPDWGSPLLKPKTNLRICDTCGHHYEAFHLCGHCYERVKKETQLIREQAEAQFGHGPEDKGVVIMYDSDKQSDHYASQMNKATEKNIIVEIPKARPNWFNPNLLQRSTLRVNPDAKSVTATTEQPTIVDDTKKSS